MTSFQNGGVTFALTGDNDQENRQGLHGRKTKLQDRSNVPKPSKRAALGTITNATRVQPFRNAKAANEINKEKPVAVKPALRNGNPPPSVFNTGQPTYQAPSSKAPSFSIHVDKENSDQLKLDGVVTGLACSSQSSNTCTRSRKSGVLSDISRTKCEGSPMVLDSFEEDFLIVSSDEVRAQPHIRNIDDDSDVLFEVPDYAADIHAYLKQAELKFRPKPGYMKKQADINNSMRAILVDWLVEVAEEYKLTPQTLFLSVNFIDRFLSHMSVLRGKLQLVGTACMLVASKYEEIYPPEVAEFVYITDDTYTAKQVLRMEHLILKTLAFDLSAPTILDFLHRYLKAANCPKGGCQLQSLACYLCELALMDADPFLQYLPSVIAASAVYLACLTLSLPAWTPTMAHYTMFSLQDLHSCIHDLHRTFVNAPSHAQQAIREKYKLAKYHHVTQLTPPAELSL